MKTMEKNLREREKIGCKREREKIRLPKKNEDKFTYPSRLVLAAACERDRGEERKRRGKEIARDPKKTLIFGIIDNGLSGIRIWIKIELSI